MTLSLERARSRRPVTWLTLLGVLLLPVVIGGLLIAALYNPVERLDAMNAAIVNNDEPVTIGDQYVPLGRQLTAGLVEGSDDIASNLTWTISNDDDAAVGLADGTYDAVITIPANFSAAATSTAGASDGSGGTAEQATISVTTSPDSRIVDDAITSQVTQAAAGLMGQQLSTVYLENVFLGFTTLSDQLGTAADGAHQLADGAGQASDGAVSLADGVQQLSDGAGSLSSGLGQLSSGTAQYTAGVSALADGLGQLASGSSQYAAGVQAYAAGAHRSAAGLSELSQGADQLVGPSQQLAAGLQQFADQVQGVSIPQEVIDAANSAAANGEQLKQDAADSVARLQQLAADCTTNGYPAEFCTALTQAADSAQAALPQVDEIIGNSQQIADGLTQINQLPDSTAQLAAGAAGLSQGIAGIAGGLDQAAAGAQDLADGADGLATGAASLASGTSQSASGAAQLAAGGSTLASGTAQSASGAAQLADGASSAADGASSLADGVGELADGTSSLADGLTQAADAVPSYTEQQATDLASVVVDPVSAQGTNTNLFGASAIPLLAMLALWFGGLASFIALQAVPRHALSSRRPSALLALRSLAPVAAIGAAQGLLVAIVVQFAADYDAGAWWTFAGLAVVAGVAFAAVNQALVAVFGGAGRWVSALIGVLAVATGVVSTIPGVLASIASLMPTAPAYNAMLAALTPAGGLGAGLAGMIIWAGLAFVATVIAVGRRRTASTRELLAASPALA